MRMAQINALSIAKETTEPLRAAMTLTLRLVHAAASIVPIYTLVWQASRSTR